MFSHRDLLMLIIPLVIEQFLAIFIGMADTLMVSSISESAVSAVSLVDSINVLLVQLFSAMATGGAVVAAQYLGRRDNASACTAAKQLLYVSFFISLAISVLSIALCEQILILCFGQLSQTTLAYCRTYFYLSALSYPALALYNGGAALLRVMRNSRSSMFTSMIMNAVNIAGNALLIYVFHMEVAGAAIASLVSRVLGAIIMIRLLLQPTAPIHLIRPRKPELNWSMIKRIFSQGIPNGLENSMFQIGKLMVASLVAMFSESIIAANAVSSNIASLANLPGAAIGLAMITVVGQCVGAGDTKQAKYYSIRLLGITYITMVLTNGLLYLFAPNLASIFGLSPEGHDAAVTVLRNFALLAALFWPASFTVPNILRAAGDSKFTMTVSVLSMWIFRIGASYLFVNYFKIGLMGIWYAMFIDWIARSIVFGLRYKSGKWLTKKIV
ncbi:MAG: MATE family efflux transporter [Clostridiales bacterium]|nr:MATE family efflux transporter [Clostridiales bacterium]